MEEVGPSVADLERNAVPMHFRGLVAHWPAVNLWQGDSGLQQLIQLAGEAHVEAMVSPSGGEGGLAVGDMQHLVLLGTTLREFLDGSLERQLLQHQPAGAGQLALYLAQSPLWSAAPAGSSGDSGSAGCCGPEAAPGRSQAASAVGGSEAPLRPGPLQPLMADLGLPAMLQQAQEAGAVQLQQANLWASMRPTRSSLHYDPYQNLLCVVRGCKKVYLLPPRATPQLHPQPLTAESANHSPADLAQPDEQRFPGLAAVAAAAWVLEIAAGDALFIPEGWWHQVDSAEGTLAVNFWWEGAVSRQLGGDMDRYYLRRLTQSLLEKQKQVALAKLPQCDLLQAASALGLHQAGAQQAEARQAAVQSEQQQQQQQPVAGGLAALVPEQVAAVGLLAAAVAEHKQADAESEPPPLITAIVATLAAQSAQSLLDVLLQLRRQQPGLMGHLLLHSLDPAGWELLSGSIEQRQEELAAAGTTAAAEEAVGAICDELYSAVQDRQLLLDAILRRKEAFSQRALRAVLHTELGGCLPSL